MPYRLATPQRIKNKWGGRWDSNPRPPGPQSDALTDCATPAIGAPEGIRTPDTRLRRAVLYPAELQAHIIQAESPMLAHILERVMGIGPTRPAWKAGVLPLNYTRITSTMLDYSIKNNRQCQTFCRSFLKIFKLIFLSAFYAPLKNFSFIIGIIFLPLKTTYANVLFAEYLFKVPGFIKSTPPSSLISGICVCP